jgi:hypothetical protein
MSDHDFDYDDYCEMMFRPKDNTVTQDRTKKYWKTEGSNTKFGTLAEAEDEAKKRAAKQNCDYDVYEFVSQAQAVVPDVPIVKIV